MSAASLLTREGEVEIFKRLEDGKRRALRAVLGSRLAVQQIAQVGERLKKGAALAKDLICDDEDEDFDEAGQAAQMIKLIDGVRRSDRASGKLRGKLHDRQLSEASRRSTAASNMSMSLTCRSA